MWQALVKQLSISLLQQLCLGRMYPFMIIIVIFTHNTICIRAQQSCEVGPTPDGSFYRLSAISKYIGFSSSDGDEVVSYHEAVSICNSNGLEIAEVNSLVDLMSLSSYITDMGKPYWIGMNDLDQDGIWEDAEGFISRFQAFALGDPDDLDGDCVILVKVEGGMTGHLRMFDTPCHVEAAFLCQYPEGSYCDVHSFQRSAEHVIGGREDLIPLGDSANLFVSTTQKSYHRAVLSCIQAQKVPLYFNDSSTSLDVVQNIKSHILNFDLDEETQFWTAGKLERAASGNFNGRIFWDVLERSYDLYKNEFHIPYKWAATEPNDIGGGYEMGCVDVSYESDGNPPVFQASNCDIPKFYICMDSKLSISKDEFEARLQRISNEHGDDKSGAKKGRSMAKTGVVSPVKEIDNPVNICPPEPIKNIDAIKLNHSALLEMPQTLDLMLFMLKNNVKSGRTKIKVKHSIVWKRDFIDTIFEIFKKAVGTEFVPHEMLHIAREINVLYQNGIEPSNNASKDWGPVLEVLDDCLESLRPYEFATTGLQLRYLMTLDDEIEILSPLEDEADNLDMDFSIDILWYVFSFSLGACFPTAEKSDQDPLVWASEYYNLFVMDILHKVMEMWVDETESNSFRAGLIFGDLDFELAWSNFRSAAVSSFILNDIEDRQIVRPLSALEDHHRL